ncbi:MAG: response regulator [Hymenobacteraceae bacterium]|nr:response regulator [Hymenobacteraceae bacterium]
MKKILLIEDNEFIRDNTAQLLTFADYEVVMAENGMKGIELAQEVKPNLIICDIMMPVLDGFEVLKQVKRNNSTAAIPFIFLTAKKSDEDLSKAQQMGAKGFLIKPFTEKELLNVVAQNL